MIKIKDSAQITKKHLKLWIETIKKKWKDWSENNKKEDETKLVNPMNANIHTDKKSTHW